MATEENIRHPKIKRANATSSSILRSFVPLSQSVKGTQYLFQVAFASELQDDYIEEIWQTFEHNMRSLYEASSFGWDPVEKKAELFHSLSRFLLVFQELKGSEPRKLLAYSMFRFEREDGRNVVYCYEMQIQENAQRLGLGSALVSNLQAIGRGIGMTDIMLTVFVVNTKAQTFYESQGFTVDPISPDLEELGEDKDISSEYAVDYRILSRRIERETHMS